MLSFPDNSYLSGIRSHAPGYIRILSILFPLLYLLMPPLTFNYTGLKFVCIAPLKCWFLLCNVPYSD
jgi:hypothetical protein